MISQGTMRPLKKILGIILMVMGSAFLFDSKPIQTYLMEYSIVSIFILIVSGYFLFKSGARG